MPDNKVYTLSDMKDNTQPVKREIEIVDPREIAPYTPAVVEDTMDKKVMKDLDSGIERYKKEWTEQVSAIQERIEEDKLNKELGLDPEPIEDGIVFVPSVSDDNIDLSLIQNTDTVDTSTTKVVPVLNKTSREAMNDMEEELFTDTVDTTVEKPTKVTAKVDINDSILDDDILEEDETEIEERSREQFKNFQETMKSNITIINDKIDLNKFTISDKPIAVNKVFKANSTKEVDTADWILFSSKRPIRVSALSPMEIEKLRTEGDVNNRLNTIRAMYNILFEHIIDGNKPELLEAWLKKFNFFDIDDLYFAIYKATFAKINTLPYNCTNEKCFHSFIDKTNFDEMIKYESDEIKEEVAKLMEGDYNSKDGRVTLEQISDKYVFALKPASVYSVLFEPPLLKQEITRDYADILPVMANISDIYVINRETNQLDRLDLKPDPTDIVKTANRKFVIFSKVFDELNSDQYSFLYGKVNQMNTESDKITYIIPERKCPKCGAVISERVVEPSTLLFIRHQLTRMLTLSI